MATAGEEAAGPAPRPAAWAELLREGRALYTVLVLLGVLLHALQILVIAIIMPTVVGDLGGADYYTWAAVLYTIGSIVGAAAIGPITAAIGMRRGFAVSALVFLAATTVCALAPDMASLIAARGVQGFAGGLLVGGSMALIGVFFAADLRRRILAAYQGVWLFAQLLGPVVGGAFAEIGWWRGSFWSMIPFAVVFAALVWLKVPARVEGDRAGASARGFPVLRLAVLAGGVFCVAAAGPVPGIVPRVLLVCAAIGLIALTFRLDRAAEAPLYPARALSLGTVVGVGLWIHFLVGTTQTSVTLFLPLLLQAVHGVSPLFVSFVGLTISLGWTIGTFAVNGWSGVWERRALSVGPVLMCAALGLMLATAVGHGLVLLTLGALVFGMGIGTHNVHLVARTIGAADTGEERITAAALPSFRSLGTAFGAASAGMLSTIAGLDDAMGAAAVGAAVTTVYAFDLVPAAATAVLMSRLVRLGRRQTMIKS